MEFEAGCNWAHHRRVERIDLGGIDRVCRGLVTTRDRELGLELVPMSFARDAEASP